MLEKRKFFSILIGYIIGIIMGLYCKISIVPIFLVYYLVYLILKRESRNRFKLISFKRYFRYFKVIFNKKVLKTIIIFSIISNSIVLYQNYRYENLYKDINEQTIKITGIIQDKTKDKYELKVLTNGYKKTRIYLNKVNSNLEYGDKVEVTGKFIRPSERTNYKGFDYNNYLKTIGIYGSILVQNEKVISKDNINIIFKYTNKLKQKIEDRIEKLNLESNKKAVLKGIILGEKEDISKELIKSFSISNISYILAVSGMHVSYIIIVSNFIFNKLIGKHYSKIATCIIIFIYMCITSFTPSVVRAGVTGILVIMSNFFYRKNDIVNSLALALIIILAYNPFLLQNIGLQLSFAGTIGIILFMPTLNRLFENTTKKIGKRAIRNNKKITKRILTILNWKISQIIIQVIFVTISASIMVIPIITINYNTLTISSLLISIIASFIVGPIVFFGLCAIAIKINIIEKLVSLMLNLLIYVAEFGTRLPLNQIYLITPSYLEVIVYYTLILSLNFFIKIKLEKSPNAIQKRILNLYSLLKYYVRLYKNKIISGLLIISVIVEFITIIPKDLKIYFIDVGQGDSTLIVTPRNNKILIDGGGSESSDFNIRRKHINAIFIRQKSVINRLRYNKPFRYRPRRRNFIFNGKL